MGANEDLGWSDARWTQIASGQTGLSTTRVTASTVSFQNTQSFKYYKLVLTDLRAGATAYGMQISEVVLGNSLSSGSKLATAVQLAELSSVSGMSDASSPGAVAFGQDATAAFDGDQNTKYVNPSKVGSGLMTALQSSQVVTSIDFTSANDKSDNDPTQFVLYGSNTPMAWDSKAWTQVASGATGLTTTRGETKAASFSNTQSFQYYKLVFTELRVANASAMQIAGVRLGTALPLGQGFDHVSVSPNGQQIAALSNAGMVAISRDAGNTWTLVQAPADDYTDVLVTNDGRVMLADRAGSERYSYKNWLGITVWDNRDTPSSLRELAADGRTWTTATLPNRNWKDLVLSDDGKTILIIEHDVGLVMGICDSLTVLDYGKVIASGKPADVRTHPEVIRAYLGQGAA